MNTIAHVLRILCVAIAILAIPAATSAATSKKAGTARANVVGAAISRNLNGTYDIRVTIRSADTGHEQYCDRFEILEPNGNLLYLHRIESPHADKQPFSVTALGVKIPEDLAQVTIRARMKPGGASGKEKTIAIPPRKKK